MTDQSKFKDFPIKTQDGFTDLVSYIESGTDQPMNVQVALELVSEHLVGHNEIPAEFYIKIINNTNPNILNVELRHKALFTEGAGYVPNLRGSVGGPSRDMVLDTVEKKILKVVFMR